MSVRLILLKSLFTMGYAIQMTILTRRPLRERCILIRLDGTLRVHASDWPRWLSGHIRDKRCFAGFACLLAPFIYNPILRQSQFPKSTPALLALVLPYLY